MTRFAVDVALLFSNNIEKTLIDLNHSLKQRHSHRRIYLSKENCFPHLSLLMGVIDSERLNEIKNVIKNISQNFYFPSLEIEKISIENLPVKEGKIKISGFGIEKSRWLYNLHNSITNKIKNHLTNISVRKNMMFNPNEIDEKDTPWMFPYIGNFLRDSSYDKFNPHITLGDGILEKKLDLPIQLETSRLAICHLGNYCTCRKVLYEV